MKAIRYAALMVICILGAAFVNPCYAYFEICGMGSTMNGGCEPEWPKPIPAQDQHIDGQDPTTSISNFPTPVCEGDDYHAFEELIISQAGLYQKVGTIVFQGGSLEGEDPYELLEQAKLSCSVSFIFIEWYLQGEVELETILPENAQTSSASVKASLESLQDQCDANRDAILEAGHTLGQSDNSWKFVNGSMDAPSHATIVGSMMYNDGWLYDSYTLSFQCVLKVFHACRNCFRAD